MSRFEEVFYVLGIIASVLVVIIVLMLIGDWFARAWQNMIRAARNVKNLEDDVKTLRKTLLEKDMIITDLQEKINQQGPYR